MATNVHGIETRHQAPATTGRFEWGLVLLWTLATAGPMLLLTAVELGVTAIVPQLSFSESDIAAFMMLFCGIVLALATGPTIAAAVGASLQSRLLGRYVGEVGGQWNVAAMLAWAGLTIAGVIACVWWVRVNTYPSYEDFQAAAYGGIGSAAPYALSALPLGLVVGALGGLLLGTVQQPLIRKHLPPIPWIVTNVVALGCAGGISVYVYAIARVLGDAPWGRDPISGALVMLLPQLATSLLLGSATGIVLVLYLRRARLGTNPQGGPK